MLSKLFYYYPGGGGGVVKTRYNAKLSSAKLANWNWNWAWQKYWFLVIKNIWLKANWLKKHFVKKCWTKTLFGIQNIRPPGPFFPVELKFLWVEVVESDNFSGRFNLKWLKLPNQTLRNQTKPNQTTSYNDIKLTK